MHFIQLPKNVEITWGNDFVKFSGPLGSIIKKKNGFSLAVKDSMLYFWSEDPSFNITSYFSYLKKLILGVSQGYRKKLRLVGVGYKANVLDNNLFLKIGYSHEVIYPIPEDIKIFCSKAKGTFLIIKGIEISRVNQIASEIRKYHRPDVYKGKGIQYDNEILHLKKGKREGK